MSTDLPLLLTLIALKFALSSGLPIVPYVTYLDSHLISACVVLVMTALLSTLPNSAGMSQYVDTFAGLITAGAWIAAQIFGLAWGRCQRGAFREPWQGVIGRGDPRQVAQHLLTDRALQILEKPHYSPSSVL